MEVLCCHNVRIKSCKTRSSQNSRVRLFLVQDPRLDCNLDFEISYVSDSVVLEPSVADFLFVDCLCEEIIFEGFSAVVCIFFASPLGMFIDVSLIFHGFSAAVEAFIVSDLVSFRL